MTQIGSPKLPAFVKAGDTVPFRVYQNTGKEEQKQFVLEAKCKIMASAIPGVLTVVMPEMKLKLDSELPPEFSVWLVDRLVMSISIFP